MRRVSLCSLPHEVERRLRRHEWVRRTLPDGELVTRENTVWEVGAVFRIRSADGRNVLMADGLAEDLGMTAGHVYDARESGLIDRYFRWRERLASLGIGNCNFPQGR